MIRRTRLIFNPEYSRPVESITDRAKRYRAQHPDVRPPGRKQCNFCGSTRFVVPHHVNGREADLDPLNLMWACKSCNTSFGIRMKKAGIGQLTKQYNPAPKRGSRADKMRDYGAAIKVMRGEWDGDLAKAIATIRATPQDVRSAYTSRSWPVRRQRYGASGRQGGLFDSEVPF